MIQLYCFANTEILQQAFDELQEALFNLKLVLNANRYCGHNLHITTQSGHIIESVSECKCLGIWQGKYSSHNVHLQHLNTRVYETPFVLSEDYPLKHIYFSSISSCVNLEICIAFCRYTGVMVLRSPHLMTRRSCRVLRNSWNPGALPAGRRIWWRAAPWGLTPWPRLTAATWMSSPRSASTGTRTKYDPTSDPCS